MMDDMELDLFSNFVSEAEDDAVQVQLAADHNNNDNFGEEGERCGICMDIVVDRGVLDCCQHWFCFVCIDNWASITNLCPLCQSEFQLITCIPVFDTIGSSRVDEDLDARDDDWCVEETNNTLSFPSYYIDENAVACLDGGACKMRSGSLTPEEASTIDTSIACDSCDIWYHASCVGFDPEGSEVDTWLCPRCLGAEQQPESKEILNTESQGNHHSLVHTYSGNVSISVADDGETALVISRVDGEVAKQPVADCISLQEASYHSENDQSMWSPIRCSSEFNESMSQGIKAIQPMSTSVSVKLDEHDVDCGPIERKPSAFGLKLSLASCSPDKSLSHVLERKLSVDEVLVDRKNNLASKAVKKRKHAENSVSMNHEDGHRDAELANGSSAKKSKARKGIRRTSDDQSDVHISETVHKINKGAEGSVNHKRAVKKSPPVDIMSIVKGKESRTVNGAMNHKVAGKDARVQKNAAGLRVKKIMRRPNANGESAEVVQMLKNDIREAVRKKSSDIGNCIVDPTLLAAFRAAVAEPSQEASPVTVKAKKLMPQKGKAREHLTKKIYATSNGKRKRAWDRDCEVEFWKHRCLNTSKPEKIATLKSVLNLLQRNPETRNVDRNLKDEDKAPILSRLYLADASVFPRKDDIKPLSVLKASASSHNSETLSSATKDTKNEIPSTSNTTAADDVNKKGSNCINNGVAVKKLTTGRQSEKGSSASKITGKTEGVPIDKRKWALEILARKTASNNSSPNHQKQDDSLKGNYPLLAELPTDLRPQLAPVRHNKIPSSVRQAQLYRLTEHFLKKIDLSSIRRRTAETELAVADAVNIEKQVADRSTSKVVYLNLCSQEIRRHTNSSTPTPTPTPTECTPSTPSTSPTKIDQSSTPSLDSETEAALRAAGLLSDSPPSSPRQKSENANDCDSPVADVKQGEPENVFEMDSQPDLDIYGDFEYDLDEEDYIGATAIPNSNTQGEGDSKVKVVFSTLTLSKTENATEPKEQDLVSSSSLVGCLNETEIEHMESKKDSAPLPGENATEPKEQDLASSSSLVRCLNETETEHMESKQDSAPLPGENATEPKEQDLASSTSLVGCLNETETSRMESKKDSAPLPGENATEPKEEDLASSSSLVGCLNETETSHMESKKDSASLPGENASEPKEQDLPSSSSLVGCPNDAETKTETEASHNERKKDSVPIPVDTPADREGEELSITEQLYGPDEETLITEPPLPVSAENSTSQNANNSDIRNPDKIHQSPSSSQAVETENTQKVKNSDTKVEKKNHSDSVLKKVEAYIKEHIRPLCKSGVITVDQYRWAVGKTTDKVMKYHSKAKNANFLIKDGDKVKKLAQQYIEAAAKHKETK